MYRYLRSLLTKKNRYVSNKLSFFKSALLFSRCIFATSGVPVVHMNTLQFSTLFEFILPSFSKSEKHILAHYFLCKIFIKKGICTSDKFRVFKYLYFLLSVMSRRNIFSALKFFYFVNLFNV